MCPFREYPILQTLLRPFRKSQQKTLAFVIAAIAEVARASSLTLATHLAGKLKIKAGSALRRIYRLLANPRIQDQLLAAQLLRLLGERKRKLLTAIDWTEWNANLRMLLASVIVGRRAIPVKALVCQKPLPESSQNLLEEAFGRQLVGILRQINQEAILLCDRGFRRASWLKLLRELGQPFVVRIASNVLVHRGTEAPRLLSSWPLAPGQVVDLGYVTLRQDQAVEVRVVGVWAVGQSEPWWLATNLDAPVIELVALYDRRMGIEQQLRDVKGCRFGVQLKWTQFRTPHYLARMILLVGVALVLWTAVGHAVVQRDPSVCLPCKHKGPRLSLVQVGIRFLQKMAHTVRLDVRFIRRHLLPPQFRYFAWLCHAGGAS